MKVEQTSQRVSKGPGSLYVVGVLSMSMIWQSSNSYSTI